ncbi:BppU family phage baseplate upper protein [Clostridium perfringens]|uniref:BppU family phage baseplate upper protein n=1 Tax=Clostridium perfringens TaxID=1502 RepID=UPI000DA30D16|nr:BppU family phage baseplate upper protein [Clostridium perfringens]SQI03865.1 Uncharacterised protein [Clostridium perfringens]
MKEIYINADDYNTDSIKTIQGNNNAEVYKLYLQYDNEKIDLTGKTVNLAFLRVGSTEGDIIENLNVTNAKEGEITLKITNKLTKKNGTYSCQLAILGEGDFLEHTATFTLTVENNIFSDITKAIADSKDFTYLENILDKASKLSEKLKENTSSATNANNNLESNITAANNINSKLLENTSAATSLNKNLESNIDLAKEVKETIKDLDTKNIEATEKIQTLTGLNSKAEELSNNINKGLPLNSELIKNVESAKTANNELIATNNDAKAKKTDLDNSLEEAKKYIAGLDGSQNIPQIRLDVDALQNGLKSNQALSYEGSSISANNTLEGRTEGMRIGGRTLVNLVNYKKIREYVATGAKSDNDTITWDFDNFEIPYNNWNMIYDTLDMCEAGKTYTAIFNVLENTTEVIKTGEKTGISIMNWNVKNGGNTWPEGDYVLKGSGIILKKLTFEKGSLEKSKIAFNVHGKEDVGNTPKRLRGKFVLSKKIMILEGDWTNKEIPSFFEGLKSFGEEEKVEDKYKISILSNGKNLSNIDIMFKEYSEINDVNVKKVNNGISINGALFHNYNKDAFNIKYKPNVQYRFKYHYKRTSKDYSHFFQIVYTDNTTTQYYAPSDVLEFDVNLLSISGKTIKYIKTSYSASNGWSEFTNIMLTEGTKDYNFESYQSFKKDILIKEPLRESDIMYEDNGKVKVYRPTKQYTFTGNETSIIKWATVKDENFIGFCITNDDIPNLTSKRSLVVCNNFPSVDGVITKRNMYIAANSVNICIEKSALATPDIEGFRAWLKANPTTIVYQLATPTVEIVENCVDIDLDTYQEKTYFNILNSLPGTLDFKVPSNIGSSLQNLAKEVNNIWDVINNLLVPSIVKANGNIAMIKLNNNLK